MLENIDERIKEKHKKHKRDFLMNEEVCFVKNKKISSIGELLIYSEEYIISWNNCGHLMKIFNG